MVQLSVSGVARVLRMLPIISLISYASLSRAAELPDPTVDTPLAATRGEQTAVLAGGCFWGIQAVFEHVRGVTRATAGYSGGSASTADYIAVSSGETGHAESVQITYDPAQITFGQLLKVYFSVAHDPTQLNRQGPDHGTQYRSSIFFATPEQQRVARAYIDRLQDAKIFSRPIVTEVVPLQAFYPAEAYHQDYVVHHPDNPYVAINDLPKVANLQKQFPDLFVKR